MEVTSNTLLLRGAHVVLSDRVAENTDVLIESGRVSRIGNLMSEVSSGQAQDLAGLTLFPGLIDIHIHGAVGIDTMDATPETLRQVSRFLCTQGVTCWLPTLVPAPPAYYARAVLAIREAFAQQSQASANREGARIIGLHYEGPFVNEALCGALHADHFKTYAKQNDLDDLPIINDARAVHMMTVAPEIDGGVDLIRELKRRSWTVSIGHTRADMQQLNGAFEAGAAHMTHFMNAMPCLHHRSPGPVGWGLMRDDVTLDVIADGVHVDPAVLSLLIKIKSPARMCLISDSIAAAGMGDGEYRIWDETIQVQNGRTSNAKGSIAGSVITMNDAVRRMRDLGVSDVDIALMGATNPARLLGIAHERGSIAPGQFADLVALDEDGRVVLTVIAGRVVFDRR